METFFWFIVVCTLAWAYAHWLHRCPCCRRRGFQWIGGIVRNINVGIRPLTAAGEIPKPKDPRHYRTNCSVYKCPHCGLCRAYHQDGWDDLPGVSWREEVDTLVYG